MSMNMFTEETMTPFNFRSCLCLLNCEKIDTIFTIISMIFSIIKNQHQEPTLLLIKTGCPSGPVIC